MGDSMIRLALRWLAHPVSLLAIVVMVVNDHVLKQAFGTWWTGKLSDVAGLVFFPALVAVVMAGVRAMLARQGGQAANRPTRADDSGTDRPRLVFLATAITAIGFTWVKATAHGAATASALLTEIAGPSVVRLDVTDLLALPALGLAAWVGLGATRRNPRQARRAMAVAAVPLALLASVATSAGEDPVQQGIVKDDLGVWKAHVQDAYGYDGDAYYTYTDEGWEPYFESDSSAYWPQGWNPRGRQSEDCVPSNPRVCFRELLGSTGIERSDDRGETWEVDWALTESQVAILAEAYDVAPSELVTQGVGVHDTDSGFVVVAHNGADGFAVRSVGGTWERVGFEGMNCCDGLAAVDFDTADGLADVSAFPQAWVWGLLLSTLALPFLALGLRWGRESHFEADASGWGGLWYVIAALAAWVALRMNSLHAPMIREERLGDMAGIVLLWLLCVAGTVGAAASYGLLGPETRRATWVGAFVGAVPAGLAAAALHGGLWVQAVAGIAAIAVLYAVYVPLARRWWVEPVPQPPGRP